MQNGLSDLNNMLFQQLNLLSSDEEEDVKKREQVIRTSVAMCGIADRIITIADTQIRAIKVANEYGIDNSEVPALIETKDSRNLRKQKLIGVN